MRRLRPTLLLLPFLTLGVAARGQAISGTSHPEQLNDPIETDHYVKPAHNAEAAPAAVYQNSFPATEANPDPATLPAPVAVAPVQVPASNYSAQTAEQTIAQTTDSPRLHTRAEDVDGEIVTAVPSNPHELHRGFLLHARLREDLNTQTTAEGSVFTAELTADAGQRGEVMLPAGSLVRGHITSVHGGRRITGGASMHLEPETVSLPDGTLYHLQAQLTDLESTQDLRVNDEGTVVLRSNPKAAAAVVGGVAGTAALTGALVGGGVGAAVGAVAGAGMATAVYLKRDVQEHLPAGTEVIFALEQPLAIVPR